MTLVESIESQDPTPIGRPAKIDLSNLDDVRREMGKLYREARSGLIDTRDATRLAYILGEMVKVFAVRELARHQAGIPTPPPRRSGQDNLGKELVGVFG
jgi:hypothetical protein